MDSSTLVTQTTVSLLERAMSLSVAAGSSVPALPGSGDYNSTVGANLDAVEARWPFLDGTEGNRLPSPVDALGNPIDLQTVDLADIPPELFQQFHSAQQLELLRRFISANGVASLVLPAPGDEDEVIPLGRIDVLMASDGRTVLILQNLSKSDIAQLSLADQTLIANYLESDAVPDEVRAKLSLAWDVALGKSGVQMDLANRNVSQESAAELIAAARAYINNTPDLGISNAADHFKFYTDQLDLLEQQLQGSALVSTSEIANQIRKLKERFDRMYSYLKMQVQQEEDRLKYPSSLDGNVGLNSALDVFLDQEKRILETQKQRLALAGQAGPMDLPTLIAILQLTYSIRREADVVLASEDLKQQNDLLKAYAVIQRLLNDVLKKFDGKDEKLELNIAGEPLKDDQFQSASQYFSGDDLQAIYMFSEYAGSLQEVTVGEGSDASTFSFANPAENLSGVKRPIFDMFFNGTYRLKEHTQTAYTTMSTQLSDAVAIINNRNQILSNDISTYAKEQNSSIEQAVKSMTEIRNLANKII